MATQQKELQQNLDQELLMNLQPLGISSGLVAGAVSLGPLPTPASVKLAKIGPDSHSEAFLTTFEKVAVASSGF